MAILIDQNTRVIVQGMGREGSSCAKSMREYGTQVIAGIAPGKGGQEMEGIDLFNSVAEALATSEIDISMVCVPPPAVLGAATEAITAGIKTILIVTETTPIHDTAKILALAREHNARVIGPSSVGIISPGKAKAGLIKGERSFSEGPVGIISKSGGMCSETSLILTQRGIGQSTVIGIGGDMLIGSTYADLLALFEADPQTELIVMYGEIGGTYEEEAAAFIKAGGCTKPVVAFISGKFASAIQDVSLGHAGAIIENGKGTRDGKIAALKDAGVHVVEVHHEIAETVQRLLAVNHVED